MKEAEVRTTEFLFQELSASARLDALIEQRGYEASVAISDAAAKARGKLTRMVAQRFRRLRERIK